MEFSDVLRTRRAVRSYRRDPVPQDKLDRLKEALQLAPSGNNREPYRFIFVLDPAKRERIAREACHQDFIKDAPVIMAACCEKGYSFDTAIAVDHMVLAATNEGLGTCWIGWFERDVVRRILNVPDNMEIPILVTIGYKAVEPEVKPRKPIEELVGIDAY